MIVLTQRDVEELLDMPGCIEAMDGALRSLARGEAHLPLRPIVRPEGVDHVLGLMPVYRGGERPLYALKTVCVFPGNAQRGLDPHQGTVTLFDGTDGRTLATMNASAVTSIRTAAVSAVATRTLARDDATTCAIVGAGHQAHAHVRAMQAIGLRRIVVASRRAETARELAEHAGVTAADTIEEAVRGADVVCTVTSSHDPVLKREWLKLGAHVNAVGACFPKMRELDTQTVVDSTLFVDRRESADNEAGDYLIPLQEGAITRDHIRAELGDVLEGAPGRTSADELTVFKSLGVAVEDLAAAEYIVARAHERGMGVEVDF